MCDEPVYEKHTVWGGDAGRTPSLSPFCYITNKEDWGGTHPFLLSSLALSTDACMAEMNAARTP